MKSLFSLCLILGLISFHSHGQQDFKINGQSIKPTKTPDEGRRFFQFENLGWGKVNSECLSTEVKVGQWISYKAKDPNMTLIVRTGKGWGEISAPTIYLGETVDERGIKTLKEMACVKGEKGAEETFISAKNLDTKKEYFILVTSDDAERGQQYSVQLTTEYTPMPEKNVLATEVTSDYIMGRVSDKSGGPKQGVLVSLVSSDMNKLESSKTDSKGQFRFQKLPKEEVFMTRIEADDSELVVEMFLYDKEGNVKERSTRIGPSLYGFGAEKNVFQELKLLTPLDWTLNVKKGMTGVAGRVVDAETFLYGRPNLDIELYDESNAQIAQAKTDASGRFAFKDLEEGSYDILIGGDEGGSYTEMVIVDDLNVPFKYSNSSMLNPDGFFEFEKLPQEIVEMKRLEERDTRMKMPADLSNMESGKPIVLNTILFATGSAELLESSFAELDGLASQLQKMASVQIQIAGHTDDQGNAETNRVLSENRAKSVHDYLVSKGISADRLSYVGYGETKPVADNSSEGGRRMNRRVEFTVVD